MGIVRVATKGRTTEQHNHEDGYVCEVSANTKTPPRRAELQMRFGEAPTRAVPGLLYLKAIAIQLPI
jgi:hypothetical protein